MGFISDLFGGGDAADASRDAANIQVGVTREQVAAQKEALGQVRSDLQPFREAGAAELPALRRDVSNLSDLATDPSNQASYIQNNPFFKALADDAQSRLFSNQAAKGKAGSGETAKALQTSLLLLGNDLLNQDISRRSTALGNRFNLTTLGQNAAAMQGTATQNTANTISNLATSGANAQAAGVVGAANAKTNAINSGVNTALGIGSIITAAGGWPAVGSMLGLSDKRLKTDIKKVGKDAEGMNLYTFKYKGDNQTRVGHMAQEVEKKHPNAVKTINDIKFIDYGALHAA